MLRCNLSVITRFRRANAANNRKFSRNATTCFSYLVLFIKTSCWRHAVAKDRGQSMTAHGVRKGEGDGMTAEEAPMTARAEAHVASIASQRIALPACPECNDLQLAPTASEFVSKGQVRHFWACEACGHEFRTSVKLPFIRNAPPL